MNDRRPGWGQEIVTTGMPVGAFVALAFGIVVLALALLR